MADKSITDLNVVPGSIDDSNTWFAVAQSGAAYKVSGHDFILALTVILDGHGGIKSITGPTTVGLVDTYTITFADDTTTTFAVENGKGITGISKTETSGLVDTYTISYNDGSTSTFTVTNGAKGDTGDSWYVWIRYSGSQPTQDSDMGTEPDNWMGIYSGTSSTAPVHYTDYDWFQIKGEKGDKGDPSTIVSQSVTYQEGTSPNVQPSGTWTTTIPVVSQGNYLWTRMIVTFNSGNPVTFFSVARMGLDGSGSVSSVNNQSPDANGNVALTADDIPTAGGTSVEADLSGVKNTLTQLDGATQKIIPILSGSTNDLGYTLRVGDYFISGGVLYGVTTAIPNGESWSGKASALTGKTAANDIIGLFYQTAVQPSPLNNRCSIVSGGYFIIGKLCFISVEILSDYTASNAPTMLSFPLSFASAASLSCIHPSSNTIEPIPTLLNANGVVQISTVTRGNKYVLEGFAILN